MGWKDIVFPRTCMGCGAWGAYICSGCVNRFVPLHKPICPMCARPNMFGASHSRCAGRYGMDGLVAGFKYRGVMRRVIGKYKYSLVTDLTDTLVQLFSSMVDMTPLEKGAWIVVPVPLHPRRERWRGFNQAAELGKVLADYFGWDFGRQVLVRKKYTTSQMKLKRVERLTNMRGAFGRGAETSLVTGRDVVLVDDVWTTGATMRECTKVLKRAGAASVWGLVWAR